MYQLNIEICFSYLTKYNYIKSLFECIEVPRLIQYVLFGKHPYIHETFVSVVNLKC